MRRNRLWIGSVLVLSMVFIAACGGGSSSPAPAAPAPTAPPAAGQESAAPDPWAELQAAAKAEGSLVMQGPGIPPLRQALVEGFEKAYGIRVEYLSLNTGELLARIDQEAQAGITSFDVMVGGVTNCWPLSTKGYVADITGVLIDPSLQDPAIWRDGEPRYNRSGPELPEDFRCSLQMTNYVMTDIFINPQQVAAADIKSWQDLLKPEFKGKIAAHDPRNPGPGASTAAAIMHDLGDDYFRDLYVGQEVKMATDPRQLAEWVARGTYPIGLALVQSAVEPLRKAGLPLERIYPEGGVNTVLGGYSSAFILKNAPHPNAARLFINWYASKAVQEQWEAIMMETSLRTDTSRAGLPDYVVPRDGVQYTDLYDHKYYFGFQVDALKRISALLPR